MLRWNLWCKLFIRDQHLCKKVGKQELEEGEVKVKFNSKKVSTNLVRKSGVLPFRVVLHQVTGEVSLYPHITQSLEIHCLESVWPLARWICVLRELHQTLSELTSGGCLLAVLCAGAQNVSQRGSLCLPQFACWAAQILNLCLGESLVGLTIVPATEVVLRIIIDTYFSLH